MAEKKKKELTKEEKRARRLDITKQVAGGVSKFCVSAFFSAAAVAAIGKGSDHKIERFAAITGGGLIGLMIGDQVGDFMKRAIDDFAEEYDRIDAEEDETEDAIETEFVDEE